MATVEVGKTYDLPGGEATIVAHVSGPEYHQRVKFPYRGFIHNQSPEHCWAEDGTCGGWFGYGNESLVTGTSLYPLDLYKIGGKRTIALDDEYAAVVTKDGVKVGCHTFPLSKVRELNAAVDAVLAS